MDIINQLFSLTVGVEPNKQTLQNLAGTLNSAGMIHKIYAGVALTFHNSTVAWREAEGFIRICGYRRSSEIRRKRTSPSTPTSTHPTSNQIHRSSANPTSKASEEGQSPKGASSVADNRAAVEGIAVEEEATLASSKSRT